MTATELRQRRRVLLVMLTALRWRFPPGAEPAMVTVLQAWLGGWPGLGRIAVGMGRQGYDVGLYLFGAPPQLQRSAYQVIRGSARASAAREGVAIVFLEHHRNRTPPCSL